MRLADYVIDRLAQEGVKNIFMVSGGGGMFLIDAIGRHKDIRHISNHHEQASVMAAEGYQRVHGGLTVALVTTGPAGTNALTGVSCAWNDSIPMLILSGQSNSRFLVGDTGVRQMGVHEVDITRIAAPITKYAVTITDAETIGVHLNKAIHLATTGRPGPVWLDLPINIQAQEIDPSKLEPFVAPAVSKDATSLTTQISQLKEMLLSASRPIFIAGHGLKLSGTTDEFLRLIEDHAIPVVTTMMAFDLMPDTHPLLAGRVGTYGQRAANFAVQNSDLVISLGSRLPFPVVGYATEHFARSAKKVVVDVDSAQLEHAVIDIDLAIEEDLRSFLPVLKTALKDQNLPDLKPWAERCARWRKKYPPVLPEWREQKKYVNSYYFFEVLSELLNESDILVVDQGATFYSYSVAFKLKKGQRAFTNGGFSPMGYGLPAAVGACVANGENRVVCVHGDGGLQLNIQELQTIVHYKLPIKLFVFENLGYLSIKHTQVNYFEGRLVGCDPDSGLSCPDSIKIAKAYGIRSHTVANNSELRDVISTVLNHDGPCLVEVKIDPMQAFQPRVASAKRSDGSMVSKPLEDMSPLLDRDEFRAEMIIDPVNED
jgi:acetolactate synthase-1/2/3 large subunit